MPILCDPPIVSLTRDEFFERDELVMRCAYASQNKLGRLCDEKVYENDMADRLRAAGMRHVRTQVPILVSHGPFTKEYRLDLVADDAVYELKTVEQYLAAHTSQVLNYAMCLDLRFIKLLNFRPSRVDGKLRASAVTRADRHAAIVDCDSWRRLSPRCVLFKDSLQSLVSDLGGYLAVSLYSEALACLTATSEARLPVTRDHLELGTHSMLLLSDDIGFHVSGFTQSISHQRSHLQRLLATLPLKGLHWVNFNHREITLTTLIP
jgi:GxxExxY protein